MLSRKLEPEWRILHERRSKRTTKQGKLRIKWVNAIVKAALLGAKPGLVEEQKTIKILHRHGF